MVLFPAVLLGMLIIYSLIGKYVKNTLTPLQLSEMVISTVLLVVILGYLRSNLLTSMNNGDNSNMIKFACILGIAYLNWYYWSKIIINKLNGESIINENKGIVHTF
jgi:hypothetical protein